jgi:hypothetical protein
LTASLADAAAQQRDLAALRKYAPLAESLALRCGHSLNQAIAQRAWGVAERLAGDTAQSAARLRTALGLFEKLGTRWQQGRTWYELGELAAAQQDRLNARDSFGRALELFEAMQAAPDAERTRAALRNLDG